MAAADPAVLRSLIEDAVDITILDGLEEGLEIGALVSGGVDSSTVYRLISDPSYPTFTGFYDSPGFDERPFARLVAGHDHHEILITADDFLEHWDRAIQCFRPPFQGPGMFGQWMVARYAASQGIGMLLSGEGGDELFGGYVRLQIVAGEPPKSGYENYRMPDGYPDTLEAALEWDWDRLGDLLAVDDQACGAFGVEARAPMTSKSVVDYVFAQDPRERVSKRMLKAAVRGVVPDAILDRTDKMGFPIPVVQWAQGPLREMVTDRIGYVPDPSLPFDRRWWREFCEASAAVAA